MQTTPTEPKVLNIAEALMHLAQVCDADEDFSTLMREASIISINRNRLVVCRWHWNLNDLKSSVSLLPRRSFKKNYNDEHFEIICDITDQVQILLYCNRDKVCKKNITWECEDAESILLALPEPELKVA